ncbi:cysteine proteinase [Lichtheimia hyalospora FSU 10163]|nr:cysteine proteinase [Lichtheimia hyalospora FSU 10163]
MTSNTVNDGSQSLKRKRQDELPWCLVESEPAIFTEMAHTYGATSIAVEEVYDLDMLTDGNIYGLIFAHPYEDSLPAPVQSDQDKKDASNVFFSCQIVTNICATLALLGILFNIDGQVDIGEHLSHLKTVLGHVDPVLRGNALGNDSLLRETHNSFADAQARAEAEAPSSKARKGKKGKRKLTEEDAYHYVSFIYLDGFIWELDGMNKFPCKVAPAESSSWINTLRPHLRQRMEEHDMYNLMSIVPGAWMKSSSNINLQSYNTIKKTIENQLTDLTSQDKVAMNGSLLSTSSHISADKLIDAHVRPVIIRKLEALKEQLEEERTQLTSNDAPNETQIAAAEELARTRLENTRRKHDYMPFMRLLFEKLHEQDLLRDLIETSK